MTHPEISSMSLYGMCVCFSLCVYYINTSAQFDLSHIYQTSSTINTENKTTREVLFQFILQKMHLSSNIISIFLANCTLYYKPSALGAKAVVCFPFTRRFRCFVTAPLTPVLLCQTPIHTQADSHVHTHTHIKQRTCSSAPEQRTMMLEWVRDLVKDPSSGGLMTFQLLWSL